MRRILLLPAIAFAAFLVLAVLPGASASAHDAGGSLTLHDDPDAPASQDVADCTFWIRGEGFPIAEGTVEVYDDRGRGGVELLASVAWEGVEGEDGFAFLAGPVTLPKGGHVNGRDVYVEVAVEGERGESTDPEEYVWTEGAVFCGEPYIPCIDDLAAEALDGGHVRLTWGAAENASYYHVYRSDGSQLPTGAPDFDFLGNTTETTFTDTTAEGGVTYTYEVAASDGALLYARSCPNVHVTAVPFFGAPLLAVAATVGVVGAYAWLRRR